MARANNSENGEGKRAAETEIQIVMREAEAALTKLSNAIEQGPRAETNNFSAKVSSAITEVEAASKVIVDIKRELEQRRLDYQQKSHRGDKDGMDVALTDIADGTAGMEKIMAGLKKFAGVSEQFRHEGRASYTGLSGLWLRAETLEKQALKIKNSLGSIQGQVSSTTQDISTLENLLRRQNATAEQDKTALQQAEV